MPRGLKLIAIALLLGGALILIYFAASFLSPPEPTQEADISPPSPPTRMVIKKFRPRKAKLPNVETLPSSDAENGVVPFTVEDGMAVAMGDIILGQPESPEVKEGFFQLPTPQPWDHPEIPYFIDKDFPGPERVQQALRHIEEKTGVRFIPYDNQPDAIAFLKGEEHCLSALGRQGGIQPIRLSANCTWHEVTHEVMHALGFIHEQSRSDRDQYLEILWPNIEDKFQRQFERLPEDYLGPLKQTEFDYRSIMLYNDRIFSKNKNDRTMKSLTGQSIEPSSQGLSARDIERVRRMFRLD